jgi:4-oxalmesaconate hydratase
VLYSKDSLELLFKTVGIDRCLFGPSARRRTVKDPRTGRWLDETRFTIEAIEWLTDADKKAIFEDNARKLFNLKVAEQVAV